MGVCGLSRYFGSRNRCGVPGSQREPPRARESQQEPGSTDASERHGVALLITSLWLLLGRAAGQRSSEPGGGGLVYVPRAGCPIEPPSEPQEDKAPPPPPPQGQLSIGHFNRLARATRLRPAPVGWAHEWAALALPKKLPSGVEKELPRPHQSPAAPSGPRPSVPTGHLTRTRYLRRKQTKQL